MTDTPRTDKPRIVSSSHHVSERAAELSTTKEGREMCQKYRDVREACLIETFQRLGVNHEEVGDVAKTLRAISGVYDQASRAASAM